MSHVTLLYYVSGLRNTEDTGMDLTREGPPVFFTGEGGLRSRGGGEYMRLDGTRPRDVSRPGELRP